MNRPLLLRYGIPMLTVAALLAIRLALYPVLRGDIPFVFFVAPIVLSAWYGGFGPGLLATLLGALSVGYFLLEPRGALAIHSLPEATALVVFVLTGALISWLMEAMHRAQQRALILAQDLRESEERLRATFDNAGVGIVETAGAEDRFIAVNDRVCQILGYRREQLMGMSVRELTYPEDRPSSDELNAQLHEGGRDRIDYEKRYLKGDGSPLWVHVTVSPVRDAAGRWLRSIATIEDTGERKRAEVALRQSEARLRTVIDSLTEGLVVSDLDGNLLHWNPAAVAMHGLASPEEGQRRLRELDDVFRLSSLDGTFWPVDQWPMARVLRGENLHELEARIRRIKDGSERVFSYGGTLVRDSGGRPLMAVLTINDVTDRKQAEQALRDGENRFRTMTNSLPLLAWIAAADGYIFWYNERWYEYTGTTPEQMEGWGWQSVHDPEVLPKVLEQWRASIATGLAFDMVFPLRGADGVFRPFLTRVVPVKDAQGRVVQWVGTNVDITERKQAEEELERRVDERTEQLQQANARLKHRAAELDASNQELEAFSYSVSHDLRTPLRAIDGFSQAVVQEYSGRLDARGQDYLQRVRGATQRLGHLIDDFQSLTKTIRTEMHRQPVDLSQMAEQVLAGLRESEPERQAEVLITPGMVAEADPHLLRTALENIIGNAWKFTSRRPVARIEFGETAQDGERVYFVRDNGAGFNPATAGKLFTPFQRLHTEDEFPGSGLGLALVQRIIRRHGGRVWAEGAVEQGATFYFTLEGKA